MRQTSYMNICYKPNQYGYEIVDVYFGEVRVRRGQDVAKTGDVLRKDGKLFILEGSKDNKVFVHPLTD